MTNPVNYQNQSIPAYSGITINITNPTINPPAPNHICSPNCPAHNQQPQVTVQQTPYGIDNRVNNSSQYGVTNPNNVDQARNNSFAEPQNTTQSTFTTEQNIASQAQNSEKASAVTDKSTNSTTEKVVTQTAATNPQEGIPQAYPPQYYLNNYNYIQNGEKGGSQSAENPAKTDNLSQNESIQQGINDTTNQISQTQEEDLSSSKGIINELDARVAEQKELEKNGKQTRVVALTNEYIMSLENYLNNPNTEIRLMAAKEILTRLDEDKNRYDDAALNALLNKMLQDPEKLVRIAALSAFSSQLASGNDYTVTLLTKIQNNPNADKEDVLQAADSLLKMSSRTEIRYTPIQNNFVVQPQAEQ